MRRLVVLSAAVMAGAAALWLVQRQSENKLREKINFLQTQVEQLSQELSDKEGLSNSIAQTGTPLPNEQLRELLKLRSEVGLLRRQTNELLRLQAENGQLRTARATGKAERQPNLAAGDLVSVDSLVFAGYATPEAAFQSTFSADIKGDLKTFLDGFTPERRQEEEKGLTGKSESEIAARTAERAAHFAASNVQILNSKLVSDDETELTVFVAAENKSVVLTMKKIADEWKISAVKH